MFLTKDGERPLWMPEQVERQLTRANPRAESENSNFSLFEAFSVEPPTAPALKKSRAQNPRKKTAPANAEVLSLAASGTSGRPQPADQLSRTLRAHCRPTRVFPRRLSSRERSCGAEIQQRTSNRRAPMRTSAENLRLQPATDTSRPCTAVRFCQKYKRPRWETGKFRIRFEMLP